MKPSAYIIGKILKDDQENIDLKDSSVKKGDIYLILDGTPENYEFATNLISQSL